MDSTAARAPDQTPSGTSDDRALTEQDAEAVSSPSKTDLTEPVGGAGKRAAAGWIILVALIAIFGGGATIALSTPFRDHVEDIKSHFSTGDWETRTEKASVESFIRAQHTPKSDWLMSFVAGTGYSFGLSTESHEQTMQILGWAVLADDSSTLSVSDTSLPAAYGSLLADSLEELAGRQPPAKKSALAVLAQLMRNPAPEVRAELSPEAHQKAIEVLRALPKADPLVRAMDSYHLFEFDAGLQFPAFGVAANPDYDLLTWKNEAQTLSDMPSNICVANVTPLRGEGGPYSAITSTYPRVLKIRIERPWLNTALLDIQQKGSLGSRHFDGAGSLRVIPTYLWVLMPQEVRLSTQDKDIRAKVGTWANAKNCCKVVCGETELRLEARSVMEREDGQFAGDIDGSDPLLFAIASRRRAPIN